MATFLQQLLSMTPASVWGLDEVTGTYADLVGSVPLTASGTGISRGITGLTGDPTDKAVSFAGGTGKLDGGVNYQFLGAAACSIVGVIAPTDLTVSTFQGIVSCWGSTGWEIWYNPLTATTARITFSRVGASSQSASQTQTITLGQTYVFACVFDPASSLIKVYFNNTTASTSPGTGSMATNDGTFQIGSGGNVSTFKGTIDDVGIFTRALTDTEVATLFGTLTNAPSGLTAVTATGNEITDAIRAADVNGDGRLSDSSFGIYPTITNLVIQGNDFSNAAWLASQVTVAANNVADPYGNNTADTATATSASHALRSSAITVTPGSIYTFSFWARRGTMTDMKYSAYDITHAADIVAATSYYSQTNSSTLTRISFSFTIPAGCTSIWVYPLRDSGVTGTGIFWRAQLELSLAALPPRPSPYVDTASTTVARGNPRITAPSSLIDLTQAWWAFRVRFGFAATDAFTNQVIIAVWQNAAGTAYIGLVFDPSIDSFRMLRSGGSNANSAAQSFAAGTIHTVIGAWTGSQVKLSIDGVAFVAAANSSIPAPGTTVFDIGTNQPSNAGQEMFGEVLWMLTGTGTLTDADAATIHGYGDADPTLASVPGTPSALWPAVDQTYSIPTASLQYSRPNADIAATGWTPTPGTPTTLYDKINETVADDANYISAVSS